ncbi:ectonucleotide pyrophosphatase/phosphodiesterase family member 1-like [Oratosquilla oratoria]|uniref:ectonucleotide pyrophosphatase/phosphodiesterase family member 1-like n=1 Tax=Oratosquilla oratoria TaxID=337810 RepID=UPI003F758D58
MSSEVFEPRGVLVTRFLVLMALSLPLVPAAAQGENPDCVAQLPSTRASCEGGDQLQLLLSLDSFSSEALRGGKAPNLEALLSGGVVTPRMIPSYPSVTFPNHYTVVTGLYPSNHGIISTVFWDPRQLEPFEEGTPESRNSSWWGGEPIWTTLEKQGKRVAVSSWTGVDVGTQTPQLSQLVSDNVPLEMRVDQVIEWAGSPAAERPHLIALSLNTWQENPEENDFKTKDCLIGKLLKGLIDLGLLPCVNILVVADFRGRGSTKAFGIAMKQQETFVLDSHAQDILDKAEVIVEGSFARMKPLRNSLGVAYEVIEQLRCSRPDLRLHLRESAPLRYHVGSQKRFEKLLFEVSPGTEVSVGTSAKAPAAEGKVVKSRDVWTDGELFVGYGPAFKRGEVVDYFGNVELYNLLCHLTGVTPAVNDGTEGSLNHLLSNPPSPSSRIWPPPPTSKILPVPEGATPAVRYSDSDCPGDLEAQWDWLGSLREANAMYSEKSSQHMPWGAPYTADFDQEYVILPHLDHFTAYSRTLKQALWTSYSLFGQVESSNIEPWTSDVRLSLEEAQPCKNFDEKSAREHVAMHPLFPPEFSKYKSLSRVAFLSSNALQLTPSMRTQLKYILNRLDTWFRDAGALNVITGPAFDINFDGEADIASSHSQRRALLVPTHLFVVATRCAGTTVKTPGDCPANSLDTIAFAYPQYDPVDNCLSTDEYMKSHLASVADIEKLTSLTFFTDLPADTRNRLRLRVHEQPWN